eukprot:4325625-Prymnesium_polylepis.1
MGAKLPIVLIHEADEARMGCEFDLFFETTPLDLPCDVCAELGGGLSIQRTGAFPLAILVTIVQPPGSEVFAARER